MPPAVIVRVTLIGKVEPSILTFTDWQGHEIGDHPQDFDPAGDGDDDSAGELILDMKLMITHRTLTLLGIVMMILPLNLFWM